jgi:prepilin-type processing-associated H-X9-DG protein
VCNPIKQRDVTQFDLTNTAIPLTARSWGSFNTTRGIYTGNFTGKLSSIESTSDIVLLICEDPKTVTGGQCTLCADQWAANSVAVDALSPAHYGNNNVVSNIPNVRVASNQDGYGNAAFCDGHASIFSRRDALRAVHSGDPVPDPAGF